MTADNGMIPAISITADCLPEAWEKAVLAVWDQGLQVKTQYDKPNDPPSRDATVMIAVSNPFNEPRIHKNFPGGPEELEAYRQEVVHGIHDHWIDPAAGKWTYTYHERLFAYSPVEDLHRATARGRSRRSIRSSTSSTISPRPVTAAGPRPSPGCPRPTRRRTIRPASSASGAGSSAMRRTNGC